MRLIASAVCALFIATLFFGMRWYHSPSVQGDENFPVIKGRVASRTSCDGSARSGTFVIRIGVADTYQSYRFRCNETVRAAAVSGSEVSLRVQPVTVGNQGVWLIRTAHVDGRELFSPRGVFAAPTGPEIVFLVTLGILLFVPIAAVEGSGGPQRRTKAASSNRTGR